MPHRFGVRPWVRQIGLAVAYGLAYSLLHDLLLSQYSLSFGFRLAVLILTPYRYWPALALGEAASSSYMALTCLTDFGLAWAAWRALPMIGLVIPIVYIARQRFGLFSPTRQVNVLNLVAVIMATSVAVAPFQVALLFSIERLPEHYPSPLGWLIRYFLQNDAGALTMVPLMVAMHERLGRKGHRSLVRDFLRHPLTRDVVTLLMPAVAVLLWLGVTTAPASDTRPIVQVAMFLPVIALALRYGWHGAALGGAAAGLAVEALLVSPYDQGGMQAQAVIALVASTMLLMGKHITVLSRRRDQEHVSSRMAVIAAQQNFHLGEQQSRHIAAELLEMQRALSRALLWGPRMAPMQGAAYDDVTRPVMRRLEGLARHLHPLPSAERTLPAALRASALAQALGRYGVTFDTTFSGGVRELGGAMHLVVYRLVYDAVAQLCDGPPLRAMTVSVRVRRRALRTWVLVHADAQDDSSGANGDPLWRTLIGRLQQHGPLRDFEAIDNVARTFEGRARLVPTHGGRRLALLMAVPDRP